MWTIIQTLCERKIREAQEIGEWPDLSRWKNRPLPDDADMQNVPPDLRMAYRMLKNAGYIPEELALHREIRETRDLLAHATDEQEKLGHLRRISLLKTKLEAQCGRPLYLDEDSPYFERVVDRLAGSGQEKEK